jgi:hypothetical protein
MNHKACTLCLVQVKPAQFPDKTHSVLLSKLFSSNVLTPTCVVLGSNLRQGIGYPEVFLAFLSRPR